MALRRNSMDRWDEFASALDSNKPGMEEILSQLNEICEKSRGRRKQVPAKATAAALGAGALAVGLAALIGGLSLVVAGAAAAVITAGYVVVVNGITDKATLKKVKELKTEFSDMVQALKGVQRDEGAVFEKPDAQVKETLVLMQSLIEGLFMLFIDSTEDSMIQRLLEVTEQCRTILPWR